MQPDEKKKDNQAIDLFAKLPKEVVLEILKYLNLQDFTQVATLSRGLQSFIQTQWPQLLKFAEYGLCKHLLSSPSEAGFKEYVKGYYGLNISVKNIINFYKIGSNCSDRKATALQEKIKEAILLASELQKQEKTTSEQYLQLLKKTVAIEKELDAQILGISCGAGMGGLPWVIEKKNKKINKKALEEIKNRSLETIINEPYVRRLPAKTTLYWARLYFNFAKIVFSKAGADIFLKKATGDDIVNNEYLKFDNPDAIQGIDRVAIVLQSIKDRTLVVSLLAAEHIMKLGLYSKQAADVVMDCPELVAKLSEDQKQKITQFQRDVSEALEKLREIAEEKKNHEAKRLQPSKYQLPISPLINPSQTMHPLINPLPMSSNKPDLFSSFKIETLKKYYELLKNHSWRENENDPVLYEKDRALQNIVWEIQAYISKHEKTQNNTIASNLPNFKIKSITVKSFNNPPDKSIYTDIKTQETKDDSDASLRENLKDALRYHNKRVESDQKGNREDFTQGFWVRKKPRGENREANCKLTEKLIEEIDKPDQSIKRIFNKNNIKRLRLQFKIDGSAYNSADLKYIFECALSGKKVDLGKLKKSEEEKQQAKSNRKR